MSNARKVSARCCLRGVGAAGRIRRRGAAADPDGPHTDLIFQWQDGKKVIVWPEELAPGKARVPTPPWSQRQ